MENVWMEMNDKQKSPKEVAREVLRKNVGELVEALEKIAEDAGPVPGAERPTDFAIASHRGFQLGDRIGIARAELAKFRDGK